MQAFTKVALVAAVALSSFGAMAGEISNTSIDAQRAENLTNSNGATASQEIGVTYGSGRILNSDIHAADAKNHAASRNGFARQYIGVSNGGTMDGVHVWAQGAFNQSTGSGSRAYQEIGMVGAGGTMKNVTVFAQGATNKALQDNTVATQSIGVVK